MYFGFTCRFGGEPVKKRSKLVLPTPQISEGELDEVSFCLKIFKHADFNV